MEEDGVPVVRSCTRCPALVDNRTQIVNGQGDVDASVLFVGEAPGKIEDERGVPFVGRSGDILNETLTNAGYDRSTVRITNCVRCRPPENRTPHVAERSNCRPYLDAEIETIDPAVILTLGKTPAEVVLGRTVHVTEEVGTQETHHIGNRERIVVIGLHPAATLYNRSIRPDFDAAIELAFELTTR